jgi:DnaK suppressor protein
MLKRKKTMVKQDLESRRQTIKNGLELIAKKSERGKNNYEAKFPEYGRAEDENADEVATFLDSVSLGENLKESLTEIDMALNKIEKGNYGICESCGKKISADRLKILPTARYCLNCKKIKGHPIQE